MLHGVRSVLHSTCPLLGSPRRGVHDLRSGLPWSPDGACLEPVYEKVQVLSYVQAHDAV
jgi:hypothetical protein